MVLGVEPKQITRAQRSLSESHNRFVREGVGWIDSGQMTDTFNVLLLLFRWLMFLFPLRFPNPFGPALLLLFREHSLFYSTHFL